MSIIIIFCNTKIGLDAKFLHLKQKFLKCCVMASLTDAYFLRKMKTMKSIVFSKYSKHMKMYSESYWLLELFRTNMSGFTPEIIVNANQSTDQESYQCTICDRRFLTNRELSQQLKSCQSKNINAAVSDTVVATDKSNILDNESFENIETPEVRYEWGGDMTVTNLRKTCQ